MNVVVCQYVSVFFWSGVAFVGCSALLFSATPNGVGAVVAVTAVALSEIATIDELAALCALSAPCADSVAEPVESNALRGLLAGAGLVPYVARCGTAADEFEVQIADLVGDLHHLADECGTACSTVPRTITVRNGAGV